MTREMKMKGTAAIYARVSTKRQGGDDKVSLEDQRERCLARATADGLEVPEDLIFAEKGSGRGGEDERPGFHAMMEAARAARFCRVYFWNGTRFSRDDAVAATAFKELRRLDVEYVSLSDPDMRHTFTRAMVIGFAQYEADLIRERTMRGKNAKRDKGLFVVGTIPFGYKRGPGQTLAFCEAEGPVLRRIYEETIGGHGRISIARRLNKENVPPPFARIQVPGRQQLIRLRLNEVGGWEGLERWLADRADEGLSLDRPPRWSEGVIAQLIKKSVNYGVLDNRKLIIHGGAVVTQSQHEAAVAAMRGRNMKGSKPRNEKMLTGKVKCGNPNCRRHYVYHISGQVRSPTESYVCMGKRSGTGCSNKNISLKVVEQAVVNAIAFHLCEGPGYPRIDSGDFLGFLLKHGQRRVDETMRELEHEQTILAELEAQRKNLTATAVDLKKLGCSDADLTDIAGQLAALTPEIEARRREIDELVASLAHRREEFHVDEEEMALAASRAEQALAFEIYSDGTSHFGIDAKKIISIFVKDVLILPDVLPPRERVIVSIDQSDDALARFVRLIAAAALDEFRDEESVWRRDIKYEPEWGRVDT